MSLFVRSQVYAILIGLVGLLPVNVIGQSSSFSPIPVWTWMGGGNNDTMVDPVYGTQGVAAPENNPGGRTDHASWTDHEGNLWLFGGMRRYVGNIGNLKINDLWKYDVGTNMWTWMKGENSPGNMGGVYGTQGVPAEDNTPSGRYDCMTWTGSDGRLWLFGGNARIPYGTNNNEDLYNDLWVYDPDTNNWTWMKGPQGVNQPGVPGVKGVAHTDNCPRRRAGGMTWTDLNGNLWLQGGGIGLSGLCDLWKYDVGTNNWTWMNGTLEPNYGVKGGKGVSAAENMPGIRCDAVTWTDAEGKFWFFGGGFSLGEYDANEIWKFDPVTNQWAWMQGGQQFTPQTRVPQKISAYGVLAPANIPSQRSMGIGWLDNQGKLWHLGGLGWSLVKTGYLDELWQYDSANNAWGLMKGSAKVEVGIGNYGIKGVASPANYPPNRHKSASWTDLNGNMWFYGGSQRMLGDIGHHWMDDLWKMELMYLPTTPTLTVMEAPKAKIKLNFAKESGDALSLSGAIQIPEGFNVDGAMLGIKIGDLTKSALLDAKGSVKDATSAFSVKVKNKKGVVAAQLAKFKFSVKKTNIASLFESAGMTSENVSGRPCALDVMVQMNDQAAHTTMNVTYSGKAGKSGSAK